jgi:F-box-like
MTELYEDVLLLVFRYLTFKDLANCEAVCCQWRSVLLRGTPWRICFRQKLAMSLRWREGWKRTGIDEQMLRSADYRDIYRAMHLHLMELDRNWRTGQYREINVPTRKEGCDLVDARDDWVTYVEHTSNPMHSELVFWNMKSQASERYDIGRFKNVLAITELMFIYMLPTSFAVFDRTTGQITTEVNAEPDWEIAKGVCRDGVLVVCFRNELDYMQRLCFWKIESPSRVSFLKEWTFECARFYRLVIDQSFIALSLTLVEPTLRLISTETLEIEQSIDVDCKDHTYLNGVVLYVNLDNSVFQVYDVASKRYFHELPLPDVSLTNSYINEHTIGFNTKYLVIAVVFEPEGNSELNIYNFEAIKNPCADKNSLLLATFQFELSIYKMIVNETHLCLWFSRIEPANEKVAILDFAPSSFNFGIRN